MYKYFNKHPKNLIVKDCFLRSYCTALNKDYMETRKLFNRLKKSQSKYSSYKQIGFIKDYILNDYEWIAFKSVKNQSRMNGVEFMNKYNKGIYILRMAHHCTVCIDGDILDTWDCTDKCVYGAWKIS